MRKRVLTMFLTICLIITMLPVGALALEKPPEPASTGESASPSSVADSMVMLSAVTTVATEAELKTALSSIGTSNVVALGGDISMTTQLTVGRNVTLDLNGHNLVITLDATEGKISNGIKIASGVIFTIRDSGNPSTGKLTVTNKAIDTPETGHGAAINTSDGTLVIKSGTVNATAYMSGAGIGGGLLCDGGTVTISGGSVIADGGYQGAGIGGGAGGSGGLITINGGSVTATSSALAAGIGGGQGDGGGKAGGSGTVTITGGSVTATGSVEGAGIGSGHMGDDGGSVSITGGTVVAGGAKTARA